MRYAALLRGINVGGNKSVPMADLRAMLTALGYDDVTTILQSGNAIFTAVDRDPADIEAAIEDTIRRELGFDVAVLLRAGAELQRVVEANPFPDAASDPKSLHVAFLSALPSESARNAVDRDAIAPDRISFGEKELYIWYANGSGRSKVNQHVTDKKLGVAVTARNWNTVLKLVDLANG